MNAKKLVVIILMVFIGVTGYNVLRSEVARSQAGYHPPVDNSSDNRDEGKWLAAPAAEKSAASKAIVAQLDAFKQDDYAKATTYQSMRLSGNFRTVDDFRRTIEHGYPEFAHYKSIVFGNTRYRVAEHAIAVQVTLTGEDGVTVAAIYYMHKENGAYKVSGVVGGSPPRIPRANQKAT